MRKPFRVSAAMRSKDKIEAASGYMAAGFKVIVTIGKRPFGKYFTNGCHSATDDIEIVMQALREKPNANLAVTLDNMTVVDVDGSEGRELIKSLLLPDTLKVKTARGTHSYFHGSVSDKAFKAHQVDVLTGPDRYVLVPPSVAANGHPYRWLIQHAQAAADVPKQIGGIRKSGPRAKAVARSVIRKGERNDTLFKLACSMRRYLDEDGALAAIQHINAKVLEAPLPEEEVVKIVASAFSYKEDPQGLFGPPDVRESLPQEFLWYPFLPRHGVTLLAGDPGRGKSLLVALLIAAITSGKPMPLTGEPATGKRVLLLSAEDNWARVTLPRLEKAGFDIDNLQVMKRFRALTDEMMQALAEAMRSWRPDLVVIDTLSAYMGGNRDMHRQNEVGEFLAYLNELAEETGAAILGLAHLNKQGNEMPLYRIVGSIGFAASIRSALFFGKDPDHAERLAMAHGKANGSEEGPTIVFERVGGGRDEVPVLRAVGMSDATAADVCRVEKEPVGRPSVERDAAIAYILGHLTDEPVSWSAIKVGAEARSIASEATLNTVRARLAAEERIEQVGKGKATLWKLGPPTSDSE